MKARIWLIENAEECWGTKTGKAHYQFVDKGWEPDPKFVKAKNIANARLEDLAELCDQDAEDANAHDICGAHARLAILLHRHVTQETATAIMRDIAEHRGLHGLNEVGGL